jgi:hypothetical protein
MLGAAAAAAAAMVVDMPALAARFSLQVPPGDELQLRSIRGQPLVPCLTKGTSQEPVQAEVPTPRYRSSKMSATNRAAYLLEPCTLFGIATLQADISNPEASGN